MSELERLSNISGAYDLRDHPRNYGISAMKLWFAVKGPKGGVSVSLSTSWYLPSSQQSSYELYSKVYPFDPLEQFMAPQWWDVSQHHKEKQYDWQTPSCNCELTGGDCYSDGTSLWGREAWLPGFLHGGSDWLFARLEDYYREIFEDGPPVDLTPVPVKVDENGRLVK